MLKYCYKQVLYTKLKKLTYLFKYQKNNVSSEYHFQTERLI